MSHESTLATAFPGALPERAFVHRVAEVLEPVGFTRETTVPCVATCRDELCRSWPDRVCEIWGPPFDLSGLGGWTLAGKAGFDAALTHAPDESGRERYVFFAGPHVAIGPEGEPGACARPGRRGATVACGALAAVLDEVRRGRLGRLDDPDEIELGRLRARVGTVAIERGVSDLFELTRLTHDLLAVALRDMLAERIEVATTDYAVATGIQIHLPDGDNLIQPRDFYAILEGERRGLPFADEIPA